MKELNDENHIFSYNKDQDSAMSNDMSSSASLKEFEEIHKRAKQLINDKQEHNIEDLYDDASPPVNKFSLDSLGNHNQETGTFNQPLGMYKPNPEPQYHQNGKLYIILNCHTVDNKPRKMWG